MKKNRYKAGVAVVVLSALWASCDKNSEWEIMNERASRWPSVFSR
jgi:hypothetical protein